MAASSPPEARSHLLTHTMLSQWFPSAMAMTRSMRKGSVTGMAWEATITNWSMLATAGRWNWFLRGRMASMAPWPLSRGVNSTRSPTRGVTLAWRSFPLPRQAVRDAPSST